MLKEYRYKNILLMFYRLLERVGVGQNCNKLKINIYWTLWCKNKTVLQRCINKIQCTATKRKTHFE